MSKNRVIINVAEGRVSNDPSDVLATYSLGSCIGVCLYDPVTHVGGLLHYQLPSSMMDAGRAEQSPMMFADTGMNILIRKMLTLGANKKRMQIRIAGGAAMDNGPKGFDIGKRNHLAIKKILWQNGMFLDAEDVGGSSPRNLYMNIANGAVTVRTNGLEKTL
ncbi:MAG TPA: chemotaxis protein CheD [Sedimentisphaerales bacterium]|jgi:chemotaxis protein CheD|nr:chemotaxis protein CheD [Sedimentisphaerales bacterium]